MKILQLNVWTGRLKGALERFVRENDADIICMQEAVWSEDSPATVNYAFDSVDKLMAAGNYKYDYRTANFAVRIGDECLMKQGNAIISKMPILEARSYFVGGTRYTETPDLANGGDQIYSAQKVVLDNGLVLINHHGFWSTDPLGDERHVKCMREVADLFREERRPVIMCGDLNVVSESPAMRELDFMRDLTSEYGIKQTLQNLKFVKDVACDHVLVNDKIIVKDYRTIDQLASDHKAVFTEIEMQ